MGGGVGEGGVTSEGPGSSEGGSEGRGVPGTAGDAFAYSFLLLLFLNGCKRKPVFCVRDVMTWSSNVP